MAFHYYICGVRQEGLNTSRPGELSLDFVVGHTRKEIKQAEIAKAMVEHKIVKTTDKEAIESVGLTELSAFLSVIPCLARANSLLVVKFETKFKMTRKDLEDYIKTTPLAELKKAELKF